MSSDIKMRRKIVFWLPQGRLGNLIFQYQAAISLFPENSMIISLESEFSETFEHAPFVKFIPHPKEFRLRFTLYWLKMLRWCVKKRILSSIMLKWSTVEIYPIETMEMEEKIGWFSKFWVIDGFFQHDHYAFPKPRLKKVFLEKANKLLHQIPQDRRVAVHLRFGDYEKWTIFGKQGVCLPSAYYQNAMARLAQAINNPIFVIFSDDKKSAQEVIGSDYSVEYFDGDSFSVDIAGISLCSHAIISASTFSWWGAFLIKNSERIVIAPKYWAGFKSGVWFPVDIQTESFEYIDAD
jgi:Glycosyl transferase family 11